MMRHFWQKILFYHLIGMHGQPLGAPWFICPKLAESQSDWGCCSDADLMPIMALWPSVVLSHEVRRLKNFRNEKNILWSMRLGQSIFPMANSVVVLHLSVFLNAMCSADATLKWFSISLVISGAQWLLLLSLWNKQRHKRKHGSLNWLRVGCNFAGTLWKEKKTEAQITSFSVVAMFSDPRFVFVALKPVVLVLNAICLKASGMKPNLKNWLMLNPRLLSEGF